jgi:hypothetical protein
MGLDPGGVPPGGRVLGGRVLGGRVLPGGIEPGSDGSPPSVPEEDEQAMRAIANPTRPSPAENAFTIGFMREGAPTIAETHFSRCARKLGLRERPRRDEARRPLAFVAFLGGEPFLALGARLTANVFSASPSSKLSR